VPVLVEYWHGGGVADLGLKNLQLDFRQQLNAGGGPQRWCRGRERMQLAMTLCVVCVLCMMYSVCNVESLSVLISIDKRFWLGLGARVKAAQPPCVRVIDVGDTDRVVTSCCEPAIAPVHAYGRERDRR
jgi:hypothetical protein